jgi:ureidoacrylate peracid hydrolase
MLDCPALLIVDMQVGFVADSGAYARAGRALSKVKPITAVIERLRTEFRNRGLPRFFTAYRYRSDGSDYPSRIHRVMPSAYAGRSQPWFTEGSPQSAIISELTPASDEPVVFKNRYSAFFGTDLKQRLDLLKVRTVVLTGVLSHVCVDATARDAFSHDYDVVVVRDGVAGLDPDLHAAILRNLADTVGAVIPASEVVRSLPPSANA